jgi:hypothetical protein
MPETVRTGSIISCAVFLRLPRNHSVTSAEMKTIVACLPTEQVKLTWRDLLIEPHDFARYEFFETSYGVNLPSVIASFEKWRVRLLSIGRGISVAL